MFNATPGLYKLENLSGYKKPSKNFYNPAPGNQDNKRRNN